MGNFLLELTYTLPAILIALTLHEFSHARVAYAFGDPTAKNEGRLSLNPLRHLDPIGALLLLIAGFGWAKAVPVNPFYFEGNRKRKMLWVSLAGPVSNLLQAFVGTFFLFLFMQYVTSYSQFFQYIFLFLLSYIQINLMLAVFNILPIPPLDGSKILAGVLPNRAARFIYGVERHGSLILLLLVFLPRILGWLNLPPVDVLGIIIGVPVSWLQNLFFGIFGL